MTSFSADSFTFDLVSLNITALTTTARQKPLLRVKIVGFRLGEESPATQKTMVVRNAFGGGGAVFVAFSGKGWKGLARVGIEAEEEGVKGVPKPGEFSPGFVLDDVVYVKRGLC